MKKKKKRGKSVVSPKKKLSKRKKQTNPLKNVKKLFKKKVSVSISPSIIVLAILVLIMIIIKILSPIYLKEGQTEIVFLASEILIVAFLGFISILLLKKLGGLNVSSEQSSKYQKFLNPIMVGICFGLAFIVYGYLAEIKNSDIYLPLSVLFYLWESISYEIIFHIFPIVLFVWLFGNLIFKRKKDENKIFWIVAIIISILGAYSTIAIFSTPGTSLENPGQFFVWVFGILIFVTEVTALYLFKKYGLLAPILMKMSFYLIFNIIWPLFFMNLL